MLQNHIGNLDTVNLLQVSDHGWMPDSFGNLEAEYAALRRHVGIFPAGHRALIHVTGTDSQEILQNLSCQQLQHLQPGQAIRGLFLNDRGYILADAHIICTKQDQWWLDTWEADADALTHHINRVIFSEDCQVKRTNNQCIGLLGIGAPRLHQALLQIDAPESFQAQQSSKGLLSYRLDLAAGPNIWLWQSPEASTSLFINACERCHWINDSEKQPSKTQHQTTQLLRGRPVGWEAWNACRIEDHSPFYHIDFGPTNVPAEVGETFFHATTNTTKGCYPGQEAVLRMFNLGHPKKLLVPLTIAANTPPLAGTELMIANPEKRLKAPRGGVIGAITSSCLSPLKGAQPIAMAMLKWRNHTPGTEIAVAISNPQDAGGEWATATVQSASN